MRGGLILKTTQMYARFQNGGGRSLKAHMAFQYSASCFGVLIFPTAGVTEPAILLRQPRLVHQLQSLSLVGAIIKSRSVVSRAAGASFFFVVGGLRAGRRGFA